MRKQGDGDRFISPPWTHPSQREIGIRVRPGQDWFSFTWIAMCVIMGAKYVHVEAMIDGGNFQSKFKNKFDKLVYYEDENSFNIHAVKDLIDLVTKFGEVPELEELEKLAMKILGD